MNKTFKEELKSYLLYRGLAPALAGLFCVLIVWVAFTTKYYELIGILVLLLFLLLIIKFIMKSTILTRSIIDLINSFRRNKTR
jgi:hypothetical protein